MITFILSKQKTTEACDAGCFEILIVVSFRNVQCIEETVVVQRKASVLLEILFKCGSVKKVFLRFLHQPSC